MDEERQNPDDDQEELCEQYIKQDEEFSKSNKSCRYEY